MLFRSLVTNNATTALAAAVRRSQVAQEPLPQRVALQVVQLALDFGIDPNVADTGGDTAVHTAASLGYEEVLQLLVGHGADVNTKNQQGETPLRVAEGDRDDRGLVFAVQTRAAEMLRKLGGTIE